MGKHFQEYLKTSGAQKEFQSGIVDMIGTGKIEKKFEKRVKKGDEGSDARSIPMTFRH